MELRIRSYSPQRQQQISKARTSKQIAFGDSLGIIKPEAKHLEEYIFKKIQEAGFNVVKKEETILSKETIQQHYAGLKKAAEAKLKEGKDFLTNIYNQVIEDMQAGPVTTFIVKGDEAETLRFKKFVGATRYNERDPKSLRGIVEKIKVHILKKANKSDEEINKYRDRYTFVHASDTDYFDEAKTIKNYDREIDIHFPGYRAANQK